MKGGIRAPRTVGGTWAYRIDLGPGPGGRRNQQQVAGFSSREDAEAALAEALAVQGGGDSRTVAGFLERVWLPAKQGVVERSTWDQYVWAVRRHIVPSLGAMKLAELTPQLLQGWLADLLTDDRTTGRSPLATTSVRLVRKVLSMACVDAVERGFLTDNPVRRTAAPPAAVSGGSGWTVDEARRFLTAAAGDRLRVAFQLVLVTGLRRGELLGLRWSDIDFATGRLRIRQQLVLEGGHVQLKPLRPEDRRVISLAAPVVELLAKHRHQQDDERAAAGHAWRNSGLVFSSPTGGWLIPEHFARAMDDLIEHAGVPRVTPNGLRYTARRFADASHGSEGVWFVTAWAGESSSALRSTSS